MSEHLLKFILMSELSLVRVVCQGNVQGSAPPVPCNAVFEMPLDRLAEAFKVGSLLEWRCPFCKCEYHLNDKTGKNVDPFTPLVNAMKDLLELKDRFNIEFVIADKAN